MARYRPPTSVREALVSGASRRSVRMSVIGGMAIISAAVLLWTIPAIFYHRLRAEYVAAQDRAYFLEKRLNHLSHSFAKRLAEERSAFEDRTFEVRLELRALKAENLELKQRINRLIKESLAAEEASENS
jgi:hypothetical protein